MNSLRLPPFRMIHAAYVTHDVERGKRRLTSLFGVTDFADYPEIDVEVPGGVARIAFALANANGAALEVIQPLGEKDHVYRQALTEDPDDIAFHHFATRVDDEAEWRMIMDAIETHGFDTPVLSRDVSGPRYVYLDARPQLGHMLEFIWGSPGGDGQVQTGPLPASLR